MCFADDVIWITVKKLALNYLSTGMTCVPSSSSSTTSRAQCDVHSFLLRRTRCFLRGHGPQPEVTTTPSLPVRDRLKGKRRGYHGEEVVTAVILTLAQLSPTFPPRGTAGTQPVLGNVGRDLERYLSDALRCRTKDADIVRPVVKAKVLVKDQSEWDNIGKAHVELGVFRTMDESEIPVVDGELVLCGCFGVIKTGKFTPDGRPVLRLIMDVRATNAILISIAGDMGMVAGGPSFLRMVLTPDEGVLFSTDDFVGSFYLLEMPSAWHGHFTFSRRVRGSAVGSKRLGVSLAACVLPMGFSAAIGIMQSWHRRLVIDPTSGVAPVPLCLSAEEEILGDRHFSVSADLGDRLA